MKKTLFAIFAAASLLACSKSQVIETLTPEAIAFDNAFVDNATKAVDNSTITKTTLGSFNVWATTKGNETDATIVPILAEVTVSTSDNGTTWSYPEAYTQYWIAGNSYVFAAVKNYNSVALAAGVPATIVYDATNQLDLLYAAETRTGLANNNPAVAFTFEHLLSKAHFTVKNTMDASNNNYSYRVSNVAINNAAKEATYTVAGGSWGTASKVYTNESPLAFGHVNAATADATDAVMIKANESYTSQYSRLLIPAVYSSTNKMNITCTIETLYGTSVVDVQNYNKDVEFTFTKGNAYNFVLTLANPGEKIEFTVTKVNDWITDLNNNQQADDDIAL